MHSAKKRLAFTLVELLVVIAIIGILVSLLLPAIQSARESARRTQCVNRLRQIGLGLHNYHDTYNRFPLGHVMGRNTPDLLRGSWIKGILPFMEQQSIYDLFNHDAPWWQAGNQPVRDIQLNELTCPSDIEAFISNNAADFGFRGNYAANSGIGMYRRHHVPHEQNGLTVKGPFVHNFSARFSDITDGTSNTAAVTEIRKAKGNDSRGALFADSGTVQYTHDYVPNERVNDVTERCASEPEVPCTGGGSGGPHRLTARSRHPGGVNLLVFDGAVLFVSDDVNRAVWHAAASMSGGETDYGL